MTSRIAPHLAATTQTKPNEEAIRRHRLTERAPAATEPADAAGGGKDSEVFCAPGRDEPAQGAIGDSADMSLRPLPVGAAPSCMQSCPTVVSAPARLFLLAALAHNRFWLGWLSRARI